MRRVSGLFVSCLLLAGMTGCFWKKSLSTPSLASRAKASSDAPPEYEVKSKLDYAKQNLTSYCPLEAVPDDLGRCKQELKRAHETLDGVHPARRGMPEYAEVSAYAKKVDGKVPGWEKQLADEKAAGVDADRLRKEFSDETRPLEYDLLALWHMKAPDPKDVQRLSAKDLDELVAHGQKLAGLRADCEGKYKGKRIPSFANASDADHPRNACETATRWQEWLRAALPAIAAANQERAVKHMEEILAQLEEKGVLYPDDEAAIADPKAYIAAQRTSFEGAYRALGVDLPADLFTAVAPVAQRYPEALAKAGKENRWDAKHHDKQAEKALEAAAKGAGLKVHKTALVMPDADIVKNDVDLPLRKVRTGFVATKRKGESFCRAYQITATSEYMGGGAYASPQAEFDPRQPAPHHALPVRAIASARSVSRRWRVSN